MPGVRSLQPLPGGIENYPKTLAAMLDMCLDPVPVESLREQISGAFPTVSSERVAGGYISGVLYALGLAERSGRCVIATRSGRRFAKTLNLDILEKALLDRVEGIPELLKVLEGSDGRMAEIQAEMAAVGFEWLSDWQVRFRLRWLRVVGLTIRLSEKDSNGRYPEWTLTSRGRRKLASGLFAGRRSGAAAAGQEVRR
jgi:hypothetical protein